MERNILILCTGNSCRSQMAEGYFRHYGPEDLNVYSAGIETHGVNPKAIEVMKEDGIDISGHTSNHIDEYAHIDFDYVLTVCDHAREQCPVFPSQAEKVHKNFPDPARVTGSADEVLQAFRNVRDQISVFVQHFCTQHLVD